MIGPHYWSTGITFRWDGRAWNVEVPYYDDGFLDDAPELGRVSTEGVLRVRYAYTGSDLDAVVDALKADAERQGIVWPDDVRWPGSTAAVGPTVYRSYGPDDQGEESIQPEGWRDLLNAQARRLGWRTAYEGVRRK